MTAEQIDNLVARYLGERFEEIQETLSLDWRREVDRDAHVSKLAEHAESVSTQLAQFDYGATFARAAELLPTGDEQAHRRLARRLLEAELEALQRELVGMRGGIVKSASSPVAAPKVSPKLSEVMAAYVQNGSATDRWDAKTLESIRLHLRHALELLVDRPIGEITKLDMRELQTVIPTLPSNLTKSFRDKNLREILAEVEAKQLDVRRPAPRTVNKTFQDIRSFFRWAVAHDYIEKSPATVLKDLDEGHADESRVPLTDDDLRKFLPYTEQHCTASEFWIVRILAYSGMRLAEAAQMARGDLYKVDGVWVFDINARDWKKLKNKDSARIIPVHPRLIELGLIEHLEPITEGKLWPKLWEHGSVKKHGISHNLSKTLNRRLNSAGAADKTKSVHSLRHTMATKLLALGDPEYLSNFLLGHKVEGMTFGRYGKPTPAVLLETLRKVTLPL